ncbi:hypothetical protein [Burkholderia pyrrocinia]|uniref:hypothetical protein n=1 Tax=Burkholderia pyrrocinia TaxID=60550 RepID=UPI001BCA9760|nr:hypothetical protein [Burkholderia pyrrocinia]QVN21010.1 hypothetical protein JYG32_31225 [Burkholderia pyrrocinia]
MAKKLTATSKAVKHAAGEALRKPTSVTKKQVQKLAGSVEAHIQPRNKAKK